MMKETSRGSVFLFTHHTKSVLADNNKQCFNRTLLIFLFFEGIMKNNRPARNLLISFLAILAVFTTFSCRGLFTTLSTDTGTLTIKLPGNDGRVNYTQDDISSYAVSVIFQRNGNYAVPTTVVTNGTFTAELPTTALQIHHLQALTGARETFLPFQQKVIRSNSGQRISLQHRNCFIYRPERSNSWNEYESRYHQ